MQLSNVIKLQEQEDFNTLLSKMVDGVLLVETLGGHTESMVDLEHAKVMAKEAHGPIWCTA